MCAPFTVQTLMDLLQKHTLQKIVFHMTKQEIEGQAREGMKERLPACLSSEAGAAPSTSRLFTQSLLAVLSQLLGKSQIYGARLPCLKRT